MGIQRPWWVGGLQEQVHSRGHKPCEQPTSIDCLGVVPGGTDRITSAAAKLAASASIAPGRFDAVVFLVKDVSSSLRAVIPGVPLTPLGPAVTGNTVLRVSGGGLAKVYWNRCFNDKEVAWAIFHEAAHLKSGLAGQMHTAVVGPPHGGPGIRVLTAAGAGASSPSSDDFEFYMMAIAKQITVRTRIPP